MISDANRTGRNALALTVGTTYGLGLYEIIPFKRTVPVLAAVFAFVDQLLLYDEVAERLKKNRPSGR